MPYLCIYYLNFEHCILIYMYIIFIIIFSAMVTSTSDTNSPSPLAPKRGSDMCYVCKHNMSGPEMQHTSHYAAHPIEVETVRQLWPSKPCVSYSPNVHIIIIVQQELKLSTCVIFCSGGIFHARMHCGQIWMKCPLHFDGVLLMN